MKPACCTTGHREIITLREIQEPNPTYCACDPCLLLSQWRVMILQTSEQWINWRAPWVSSALLFIGGLVGEFTSAQEPVLRIHDILGWIRIRIRGSMPLTNGSGSGSRSCYFRHWPSRCQQKSNFLTQFFLLITFWSYIYIIFQR
jgi:hypothetical protein